MLSDQSEGVELRKKGQYDEALDYYMGLVNSKPRPADEAMLEYSYAIARLLYLQGEYERSFAIYYQMLKSSLQCKPQLMFDFLSIYYQYDGPEVSFDAAQSFIAFAENWIPHLGHLAMDSRDKGENSACIYVYIKRLAGADNAKTDAYKAEHKIVALPSDDELKAYETACYDQGTVIFKNMMVDFIRELKPGLLK